MGNRGGSAIGKPPHAAKLVDRGERAGGVVLDGDVARQRGAILKNCMAA